MVDVQTWAIAASLPLRGHDAHAYAIYLTGRPWCGTGGCRLLVIADDSAGAYRFAGQVSVSQLPVRVLATHRAGWPDLGVSEYGGGERHPGTGRLRFDGRLYADDNASLLPRTTERGRVLLSDAMPETRLWPVGPHDTSERRCLRTTQTVFGRVYSWRPCPPASTPSPHE